MRMKAPHTVCKWCGQSKGNHAGVRLACVVPGATYEADTPDYIDTAAGRMYFTKYAMELLRDQEVRG